MRLPAKPIMAILTIIVCMFTAAGGGVGATSCFPIFFGAYDHYVFTPGVCEGGPPCPAGTSVTDSLAGSFWALGLGDPRSG